MNISCIIPITVVVQNAVGEDDMCTTYINTLAPELRCLHIETHCNEVSEGLVDWTHFHFCYMAGHGARPPL